MGASSQVLDCNLDSNLGKGISTDHGCTVARCSVFQTARTVLPDGEGVEVGQGSNVIDCTVTECQGTGIAAHSGSRISDCAVSLSGGGVLVPFDMKSGGYSIDGMLPISSYGAGILTGSGATVLGCSLSGNANTGITAGSGSTVRDCTALGNSFYGISVGDGSTVIGCTANENTIVQSQFRSGIGFAAGVGCTLLECTAHANERDGFLLSDTSLVSRCLSHGHTAGRGVTVRGNRSVISDNSFMDNQLDMDTDELGIDNTIIRNRLDTFSVLGDNDFPPPEILEDGASPFANFGHN